MRELQHITLRELLPPSISHDPDILAAADAVDAELNKTTHYIEDVAIIKRLRNREIKDPLLLDFLAWGFHVDFYNPDFPIEIKQELVAKSLDWHTRKGTPSAVEEIVTSAFEEADVAEWFTYGGKPYRFKLLLRDSVIEKESFFNIIQAVFEMKNTRSRFDGLRYERESQSRIYFGQVGRHSRKFEISSRDAEIMIGSTAIKTMIIGRALSKTTIGSSKEAES